MCNYDIMQLKFHMIQCNHPKVPFLEAHLFYNRAFPDFVSCHLFCYCLLSFNKKFGHLIISCWVAVVSKRYKPLTIVQAIIDAVDGGQ